MQTVVAAVIQEGERILACRRRGDQDHGGKWEFPGGKVEPGEEPALALRRELKEELGIEAQIGAELARYPFAYPGRTPLLLIFFAVESYRGLLDAAQFAETRWERPDRLLELDFLAGDGPFLAQLSRSEP